MKSFTTQVPDLRYFFQLSGLIAGGEDVKLLAQNCALVERPTKSGYTYLALNIHTHETGRLFSTSSRLCPCQYGMVARWLLAHPLQGKEDHTPPGLKERAECLFRALLPLCVPGSSEAQAVMGTAMIARLADQERTLCAATSRTLRVGILAAQVWALLLDEGRMPVVVSLDSLMKQVLLQYIPELSDKLISLGVCHRPLLCALHQGTPEQECEAVLRSYFSCLKQQDRLLELPPPELLCALGNGGNCAYRIACLEQAPEVALSTLVLLPEKA